MNDVTARPVPRPADGCDAATPFKAITFAGEPVALRRTPIDGVREFYYCFAKIGRIDLRAEATSD